MPDSCRPPPGTKGGTFHWLRCGECCEPFKWEPAIGSWFMFGSVHSYTSHHLREIGWRYVCPCTPPDELPKPAFLRNVPEETPHG